jgi:hypothetical protein
MMTRLLPALLVSLAIAAGCQNQPKKTGAGDTAAPPAVDTERVAEIRGMYQQVNPATRVGYVNAALPGEGLVSVTDVPTRDFRAGDAVTFVDLQQNAVATGRVVAVLPDAVHVRYTPTVRAPGVGDIAVKFVRQ